MFSKRSLEKEYLDFGPSHFHPAEYRDCMVKLAKVGKWLGGDRATFNALLKLNFAPLSILDVGCGGGHFTALLAKRYPMARVVGIDTSKEAIEVAAHLAKKAGFSNLCFEHRNNPQLDEPDKSFDVVVATLLCHHLSDTELVGFIKKASQVGKGAVILNDLHRHPLAYFSFKCLAPLFFNNRLVLHDGPLSIKRAFLRRDWEDYMARAGIPNGQWTINWNFAFRWTVTITC